MNVATKLEISVVGMQYRTKQSLRYMLKDHLPLRVRLEREPNNKYDENAVMVIADQSPYKDIHLGYIPRLVAEVVAPYMDKDRGKSSGFKTAKLVSVDPLAGSGDLEIVATGKIRLDT